MRLLLLAVLLIGCSTPSVAPAPDDDDSAEPTPTPEPTPEPTPVPVAYAGPSYLPCVTDAQCDPGDACTSLPGFSGDYCAPACDPAGDGAECDRFELPFATSCMPNGRCGRACGADEVLGEPSQEGADDYALCPASVYCQEVDEQPMCAGDSFGQAGNYGVCYHPFLDGPDCPQGTQCLGGDLVGLDDVGLCLPECPAQTCPAPPSYTVNATPICYDVGYEVPLCALLCQASLEDTVCPDGTVCNEFFGFGICSPEGTESPI